MSAAGSTSRKHDLRLYVLWTPESDFLKGCSCDECRPKIERLNQFEEEINIKLELVNAYRAQLNDKDNLCLSICTSAQWSKDMFGFLNKKLKRVYEKLGVPCPLVKSNSADLLELVDKTIVQRLREVGLLGKSGDSSTGEYDEDDDDILEKLETGRWYYRNTKVKDEVYALLQDIENLENDWEDYKIDLLQNIENLENDWEDYKIDETQKLEKQIECVEKLPVKQLQNEVEELIAQIFPGELREKKARALISKTSNYCTRKRDEFWQWSFAPTICGNRHASLEPTLDSIIQEVNLFKEQWNMEFAPVFTPHDRSNPKRQLVE
ncbi:hypothetical protein CASFOL_003398 [Castilleja foliolosa]|uniref:Uncharacterized protein n=1 Tax=Castilleja foliolosa TaxID=1961234 RepID=A0ABD3EH26_9LAMI